MKDTNAIEQERQRRGAKLAAEMREALEPRTAAETAAAFVAGMPDVMSFPPLPPSPAEVGDLILRTREHVQLLGWGNREQLYTASQVRALLSECAIMAAARERERTMFSRRPGLWALRAREVLELIAAPMRPDGTWNRDREACRQMAAEALGRHED